jgi:hypothetical protein
LCKEELFDLYLSINVILERRNTYRDTGICCGDLRERKHLEDEGIDGG